MNRFKTYLFTSVIVLIAVVAVVHQSWNYLTNPWTRNGQVQANVIEIAPRVSGPIVELPIRDNQMVKAGDLLFRIDPRTYQTARDQARASLDQTIGNIEALGKTVDSMSASVDVARAAIDQARSNVAQIDTMIINSKSEYERQKELASKKATSQRALDKAETTYLVSLEDRKVADATLIQAEANLLKAIASLAESKAKLGAEGDLNPQLRQAVAALRQAELNVEFTEVRAPADGYVAHLMLRVGSHVVANQPSLALIDASSYWVDGFFKENQLEGIKPGDRAFVTLMTYPDHPVQGVVDSIGWGISQQDGSTAGNLLPRVSPTFEWIRLAQRIPVRIRLVNVPETVQLRVGTTCSVLVHKQSNSSSPAESLPATTPAKGRE